MSKLITVVVIAAFTLGATALAFAGSSERRIVSKPTGGSNPIQKDLSKVNQRLSQSTSSKVNCRSVGCVNQTLTNLSKRVKALQRDAFRCEKLVNLTRYNGYYYSPDSGATVFETTALDYTEEGDTPSDKFVVYTC